MLKPNKPATHAEQKSLPYLPPPPPPQDLLVQFSCEKMTTYFSQFVKWETVEGFVLERTPVPS